MLLIQNLLIGLLLQLVSIYSLSFNDIDGNQVNLSAFIGKKMLIVTTASNSQYVSQYAQLEQLHQQYGDSLVIIAFPSNDFAHEPDSNAAIKNFVAVTYNTHFLIAEKTIVTGTQQSSLFQWLTDKTLNGMISGEIHSDFTKFFINSKGLLTGVFTGEISPTDSAIVNAINY